MFSIYSLIPEDQEERLEVLAEIKAFSEHESYPRLNQEVRNNLEPLNDLSMEPDSIGSACWTLELTGATEGMYNLVLMANGNLWDLKNSKRLGRLESRGRRSELYGPKSHQWSSVLLGAP